MWMHRLSPSASHIWYFIGLGAMWHISLKFLWWLKWLKHQNVNEALISQVTLINKHFTTFYGDDKITSLLKQLLTCQHCKWTYCPLDRKKRKFNPRICQILLYQMMNYFQNSMSNMSRWYNLRSKLMLVSDWTFIFCHIRRQSSWQLATSQTLCFSNKDAIKGVPLKDT